MCAGTHGVPLSRKGNHFSDGPANGSPTQVRIFWPEFVPVHGVDGCPWTGQGEMYESRRFQADSLAGPSYTPIPAVWLVRCTVEQL